MKFLFLLFLIGFAAARYVDVLDEDDSFSGLSHFSREFDEEGGKEGLIKKFQDRLNIVMEKMKEGFENGKAITLDLFIEFKNCIVNLKELGASFSENLRTKIIDILEKGIEKANEGVIKKGLQVIRDLIKKIGKREEDVQEEVITTLKSRLEKLMNRIKDSIEKGTAITMDMVTQLGEIITKLKSLHASFTEKLKAKVLEVMDKVIERKEDGFFKEILKKVRNMIEKIGKREIEEEGKLTMKGKLRELLEKLHEKLSDEKLGEWIDGKFPEESFINKLLKKLLKRGREFLERFLKLFGGKDTKKRSLTDLYEKFINATKEVKLTLYEKILSFLEFLEETSDSGVAVAKDKIAFIRHLAREFLDHVKEVSKDVADRIIKVLRPYKEDLGTLWDEIKKIYDSKQ